MMCLQLNLLYCRVKKKTNSTMIRFKQACLFKKMNRIKFISFNKPRIKTQKNTFDYFPIQSVSYLACLRRCTQTYR